MMQLTSWLGFFCRKIPFPRILDILLLQSLHLFVAQKMIAMRPCHIKFKVDGLSYSCHVFYTLYIHCCRQCAHAELHGHYYHTSLACQQLFLLNLAEYYSRLPQNPSLWSVRCVVSKKHVHTIIIAFKFFPMAFTTTGNFFM